MINSQSEKRVSMKKLKTEISGSKTNQNPIIVVN